MSASTAEDFPPKGIVLRARSVNSAVLWMVIASGVVVVLSDLVAAAQWVLRGRPVNTSFVAIGGALLTATGVMILIVAITVRGVRRQRYVVTDGGLNLPWQGRDPDLHLPWSEIRAMSRQYDSAPGGNAMGVAVVVERPERFTTVHGAQRSAYRLAADHLSRYGTPIFLDLTDVPGGTVRFFAAVRFYAARAGRTDLELS